MKKKIMDFFTTTLNGMAYGLFATLIVGTILSTISTFFPSDNQIGKVISDCGNIIKLLTGAGIGVGIAFSLKFDSLKTIVSASIGQIAAFLCKSFDQQRGVYASNELKVGDPLTIYFVIVICVLLIKVIFRKKTPVDILIIPLFSIVSAILISYLIRTPLIYVTYGLQYVIDVATTYQPFLMGIVIAVLMGMALTAPISSAAIAAIVFTGDGEGLSIASGAALIGCCCQMLGFAIQSRKDNNLGLVLSIGIGTSMLQFKNILKKPVIWLPTIIASSILGPISTCVLKVKCMGSAAGMGTAGLVGQIGTIASMGNGINVYLIIVLFEIIAPIILVFLIDLIFRKLNIIKDGDLKIDNN